MRLRLTVEGLRHLIDDLRLQGRCPAGIIVSEQEKRDLKQEVMAGSIEHSKDAESADHDLQALCIIQGVPVVSAKDVPRGRAWIIPRPDVGHHYRYIEVL